MKGINWLHGLKNWIQLCTIYKKLTLDLNIHVAWKWRDGKWHAVKIVTKRAGVTTLIWNKVDLHKKLLQEKKKDIICDKWANSLRRYSNYKCLGIKPPNLYEANFDSVEGRNRQQQNGGRRLQHPTASDG